MPDLPLASIVAAALIVVLAYTVFGLTGFGAAIVGVPLLAHFFPIRFCVPMMLVFDLCAGLLLGLKNRRDVDRGELLRLAPFVAVGMLVGITALVRVPERWLLGVLGAFVAGYAAWSLASRAAARPIRRAGRAGRHRRRCLHRALRHRRTDLYDLPRAPARRREATAGEHRGADLLHRVGAAGALLRDRAVAQPSLLRLAIVLLPCAVAGYFIGSHLHRPTRAGARGARGLGPADRQRRVAARARARLARSTLAADRPIEAQHRPRAPRRLGRETRIGIDDDRLADGAEQRAGR